MGAYVHHAMQKNKNTNHLSLVLPSAIHPIRCFKASRTLMHSKPGNGLPNASVSPKGNIWDLSQWNMDFIDLLVNNGQRLFSATIVSFSQALANPLNVFTSHNRHFFPNNHVENDQKSSWKPTKHPLSSCMHSSAICSRIFVADSVLLKKSAEALQLPTAKRPKLGDWGGWDTKNRKAKGTCLPAQIARIEGFDWKTAPPWRTTVRWRWRFLKKIDTVYFEAVAQVSEVSWEILRFRASGWSAFSSIWPFFSLCPFDFHWEQNGTNTLFQELSRFYVAEKRPVVRETWGSAWASWWCRTFPVQAGPPCKGEHGWIDCTWLHRQSLKPIGCAWAIVNYVNWCQSYVNRKYRKTVQPCYTITAQKSGHKMTCFCWLHLPPGSPPSEAIDLGRIICAGGHWHGIFTEATVGMVAGRRSRRWSCGSENPDLIGCRSLSKEQEKDGGRKMTKMIQTTGEMIIYQKTTQDK